MINFLREYILQFEYDTIRITFSYDVYTGQMF